MNYLVDASVAAKWIFTEPNSSNARSLLDRRYTLFAPDLMVLEVANVVWKKRMRSEISSVTEQLESINLLLNLVQLIESADLYREATNIAVKLEHPVYDCVYLACAYAINVPFITADRRLRKRAFEGLRDVEVIDVDTFPVP